MLAAVSVLASGTLVPTLETIVGVVLGVVSVPPNMPKRGFKGLFWGFFYSPKMKETP